MATISTEEILNIKKYALRDNSIFCNVFLPKNTIIVEITTDPAIVPVKKLIAAVGTNQANNLSNNCQYPPGDYCFSIRV